MSLREKARHIFKSSSSFILLALCKYLINGMYASALIEKGHVALVDDDIGLRTSINETIVCSIEVRPSMHMRPYHTKFVAIKLRVAVVQLLSKLIL